MRKTRRDIMALHDETMELLLLNSGNAEKPRLVRALLALASPGAESMSDKQRIDEFVNLAVEAAGELARHPISMVPGGVGVKIKPLEWVEDWTGGNDDIPSWRGNNPLGLHVNICFAGRLFNGRQIKRHDEVPSDVLANAKDAALAAYETRIRSALQASDSPALEAGLAHRIEHDGFEGTVQGSYVTREGKRGVVLQQIGTKVVHVYSTKWLRAAREATR